MAFKIKVDTNNERRLLTDGANGITLSKDGEANCLEMEGTIAAEKLTAGSDVAIDGDSGEVEAKSFVGTLKGNVSGNAATATTAENVESLKNDDEADNNAVAFTIGDKSFSKKVNNVDYAYAAGTADSATKADQDASGNTITTYYLPKANATGKGSATQPVYFNSSGVATPTTYQLNATVPSGAVFTDTKNTAGGTSSTSKLFLVGMASQSDGNRTYTNASVYMQAGVMTAASYNATSDARLKENLRGYEPKGSILDLPIYEYDFIDGPKDQIGCLAQDLRGICPELVDEGDGGYLSIKESKIVYLLLKEVKRLKDEIDRLSAMRG